MVIISQVTTTRPSKKALATKEDVGKIVAFFDHPDERYITYGILNEVRTEEFDECYPYIREGDYSSWRYARRLTQKEVEELI